MALWDFMKDAGKSIFGTEAAAAEVAPKGGVVAEKPDKAAPAADAAAERKAAQISPVAAKPAPQSDSSRKVEALKAELVRLGLGANDVHLTLRGDTVEVESRGADRKTMEKLILAVGNIKGIARVKADLSDAETATDGQAKAAEPVFHTVEKGENLSAIAKRYMGDANRYHAIFEANRPMLSDPDKIYPGQKLRIPDA